MAKTQGNVSGRKTTARAGTTKSAAAKAKSHVARSGAAGRANQSLGASRTVKGPPEPARTQRGPGGVGPQGGRSQSGRGGRGGTTGKGPAAKRGK